MGTTKSSLKRESFSIEEAKTREQQKSMNGRKREREIVREKREEGEKEKKGNYQDRNKRRPLD